MVVAGAWLTEPERSRRGGGWWLLLGAGAALSVAGFAVAELSEPAETAAGVVAIAGSAPGDHRRDDRLSRLSRRRSGRAQATSK